MLEIDGFISCTKQGVQGAVTFLIDTGSDITSIGEKDGLAMGLDVKDLPRYTERPVVGIGGKTDTYVIEDAIIILSHKLTDEFICLDQTLYYHKAKRYKKVKQKGGFRYAEQAISRAPSILGMDVMKKMGLILHLDWKEKKAYLEK
jgi:hypothetical protein